jgi:hypothetical protein
VVSVRSGAVMLLAFTIANSLDLAKSDVHTVAMFERWQLLQ